MLSPSELNQLTVILLLGTVVFILVSALPQKVASSLLVLLIPYQMVETRFGSTSMVLAYIVFIGLLLKKDSIRLPMLLPFVLYLLWCLASTSLMEPSTYVEHLAYVLAFASAFLVFWLCYDLTHRFGSPRTAINVFIWMNVLVVPYCLFQLWLGPGERFVLFGIHDLAMHRVRADGRLTGPFESAEITAQYFVLMEFLLALQIWYTRPGWARRGMIALAAVNIALLVATASRAEFLLLVGGGGMYLWLFRHRLGVLRALRFAVAGTVMIAAMAAVIVSYTSFGGLFDRLSRTEFDERGIPDTRQILWPQAWRAIQESPIIGNGPQLRFFQEDRGVVYNNHTYIQWPHSLYLTLLFTLGVPGLALFMLIMGIFFIRCWRARSKDAGDPYLADLAGVGVILITLFLLDGIKIEQTRSAFADYWQFFFGVFGIILAACNWVEARQPAAKVIRRSMAPREPVLAPALARVSERAAE